MPGPMHIEALIRLTNVQLPDEDWECDKCDTPIQEGCIVAIILSLPHLAMEHLYCKECLIANRVQWKKVVPHIPECEATNVCNVLHMTRGLK